MKSCPYLGIVCSKSYRSVTVPFCHISALGTHPVLAVLVIDVGGVIFRKEGASRSLSFGSIDIRPGGASLTQGFETENRIWNLFSVNLGYHIWTPFQTLLYGER